MAVIAAIFCPWPIRHFASDGNHRSIGVNPVHPQQRFDNEPFFRAHPVQSPTWVVMGQLQSDQLQAGQVRALDPSSKPQLRFLFSGLLTLLVLSALTYGRLPGGLVMLNWPLHGNDWHWGWSGASLTIPGKSQSWLLRCNSTACALLRPCVMPVMAG